MSDDGQEQHHDHYADPRRGAEQPVKEPVDEIGSGCRVGITAGTDSAVGTVSSGCVHGMYLLGFDDLSIAEDMSDKTDFEHNFEKTFHHSSRSNHLQPAGKCGKIPSLMDFPGGGL